MKIIHNYHYFNMDIDFDSFSKEYGVRRNPIRQLSPYENTMLDFDDDEIDYLEEQDTHTIWSLIEGDRFTLKPGLYYRNVIGYFVCGKKWENENTSLVLM